MPWWLFHFGRKDCVITCDELDDQINGAEGAVGAWFPHLDGWERGGSTNVNVCGNPARARLNTCS